MYFLAYLEEVGWEILRMHTSLFFNPEKCFNFKIFLCLVKIHKQPLSLLVSLVRI